MVIKVSIPGSTRLLHRFYTNLLIISDHPKLGFLKGLSERLLAPKPQGPPSALKEGRGCLVAEWIHFALFGIILPTITIRLKVSTFCGL